MMAPQIELRDISTLSPFDRNARTHSPDQVEQLAASISEFGFTNPILISPDGTIVAGHGRLEAAKALGLSEVPTITVGEEWTEDQLRAYVLADNQLALNAGWDKDLLALELRELADVGFDLNLIGFPEDQLAAALAEAAIGKTDPDDIPDEPADPVTRPGDLWILGNHRILCGDSTDPASVKRLLDGGKPKLMVTDPPYGIGFGYASHDDSSNEANAQLVEKVFALAPKGKVWTPGMMNLARDIGRFSKETRVLIWHKGFAAAGNGLGGASTIEPVLVISPPRKALPNDYLGFKTERVELDGKSLREYHPCPKPVALYEHLIDSFSDVGSLIYEPFSGSGTTLMACERTARSARSMEIDPAYVDVAIKRWQGYTGKLAVLEGKGKTFKETAAERGL